MRLLERYIYYTLLATLPIQLGKHFWPDFSFVQGIRVDYLSPTIYLSDIFLIALFVLFTLRTRVIPGCFTNKLFLALISVVFVSLPFVREPYSVLWGAGMFIVALFFGYYTALFINKKTITPVLYILATSALVMIVIAVLQFISQHSLDGIFYYLGERNFSKDTVGIATFTLFNNELMRSYATFPHPNVLAYFLFIAFIALWFMRKFSPFVSRMHWIIMMTLCVGVLLTFSRLIILGIVVVIIASLYRRISEKYLLAVGTGVLVLLLLFLRLDTLARDSIFRWDGIQISINLLLHSPLWGVGVNNFYYHEVELQKMLTPTFLQPVHNVYLLVLSQLGIAGLLISVLFIMKTFKTLFLRFEAKQYSSPFYRMSLILFVSTLIVGIFDHYIITLHQGYFYAAFVVGLCYARFTE